MGYIYVIKNNINNKLYIGQTSQSLDTRFKAHIRDSEAIDFENFVYKYKNKLYNAFRKYGVDKFYIEVVEECDNTLLNEREIYYIQYFDSYNNGYNSTLGGEGARIYSFSKEEEQQIIKLYEELKSIKAVARHMGCSIRPINEIMYKNNIEITDNSIKIVMYDELFNPLRTFNSVDESRQFIMETELFTSIDIRNYYRLLHLAFKEGKIAYGHRWQIASELIYKDKIFRTRFDKEAYISGKTAYQIDNKKYWIVDGVLDSIRGLKASNPNKRAETSLLRCSRCGNPITLYSKTGMCSDCANRELKASGKPAKPSKEELEALLDQGLQVKQIAEMYQRNGSTVSTWITQYGIKDRKPRQEKPSKDVLLKLSKNYSDYEIAQMYNVAESTVKCWRNNEGICKADTRNVTCKELNITFETLRAAARYLIDNRLTTSTDVHNVAYRISKVIGTAGKVSGFTWV